MQIQLPNDYVLKLAEPSDDVERIYKLLSMAVKRTEYKDLIKSKEQCLLAIQNYLNLPNSDHICLLLIDSKDNYVGILAASKQYISPFFNPIAAESVWWVDKSARKGTIPLRMLKAYEYWAKLIGCNKCCMGLIASAKDIDHDKLRKLYTKMGYSLSEETYVKELK